MVCLHHEYRQSFETLFSTDRKRKIDVIGKGELIKKKFIIRPIEIIVERTGTKGFEKDRK